MQTNHMLRCTICKSGTAMVEGEEDARVTGGWAFCQNGRMIGDWGSFHGMDLHGFSEKKEIFVATLGEQLQHDQSPKKTLSKPPRCTFSLETSTWPCPERPVLDERAHVWRRTQLPSQFFSLAGQKMVTQ